MTKLERLKLRKATPANCAEEQPAPAGTRHKLHNPGKRQAER